MFNPNPSISRVALSDGRFCVVVDNILRDPSQLIAHAVAQRANFSPEDAHYYPGPELRLDQDAHLAFEGFFSQYIRGRLGGRRTRSTLCRMSLVTRKPENLVPFQRIPHVDGGPFQPGEGNFAMVLYLFKDERLGGTSFFKPKVSPPEIDALLRELKRMELAGQSPVTAAPPTFAISSDEHFQKVLTVEPRFNRAIFYNGGIFHSGHITAPELMVDDPATGRLTVNAFFKLRMAAT